MKPIVILIASILLTFNLNVSGAPLKDTGGGKCSPGDKLCECPKSKCDPKENNSAEVSSFKDSGHIIQPNAQGSCSNAPDAIFVNVFGRGAVFKSEASKLGCKS